MRRISSIAIASTNSRSGDIETGPIVSGVSGNGVGTDLATPPHAISSVFCITIQAPIITSMVVSMSAPRTGRNSASSMSRPSRNPASSAQASAAKKFMPSMAASRYMT